MLDPLAIPLSSKLCGHKVSITGVSLICCFFFFYSIEPCVDHRADCRSLLMRNECQNNPYSTMMHCPKSCGVC